MSDVCGITDASGNLIATYKYDEWGNLLAIETAEADNAQQLAIAETNPFRYRSYYYDAETGYYYLQSRYYDASICRFINADAVAFVGANKNITWCNLFSYCENDSINCSDITGTFKLKSIIKINLWKGQISIKLSRAMSMVVAVAAAIFRIFKLMKSDITAISKNIKNKLAKAFVIAVPYGTANVAAEVVAWVCNVGAAVAALSAIITFVGACSGGTIQLAQIAFSFLAGYILPTLAMSVKMLYYAFVKKKGCTYTFKLLGGASVSF